MVVTLSASLFDGMGPARLFQLRSLKCELVTNEQAELP